MTNTNAKSDLSEPSPSASFSADTANPSSQTNLEKDGTTEQSIKTNEDSSEPKMQDSSQDTEKKRSVSSRDSTEGAIHHADSERPSKLIKSDAAPDVSFGNKPAPTLTKKSADTIGSIGWHSQSHMATRTKMAQNIACLFRKAYPNASNESLSEMPVMVQKLELGLYRSAPSFEAYCDASTLQHRLLVHFYNCKDPNCSTCGHVRIATNKYCRYSNMLTWLAQGSHDALVRALGFLDVTSLLQCEMASKAIKNAASDAWIAVDKTIDIKKKAHGETPRERAIRSSPIYRRYLLSQYAAKVEKLPPTSSETLLLDRQSILGDDYDFYIRFATDADEDNCQGPNRRENTLFLAGGVVSPNDNLDFNLTSLDIRRWQKLDSMLHPKGCTFSEYFSSMSTEEQWDEQDEAFGNLATTIVAIHRRTLKLSILVATDTTLSGYFFDPDYQDGVFTHNYGTMYIDEWENDDDVFNDERRRRIKHTFQENQWTLTVLMEV